MRENHASIIDQLGGPTQVADYIKRQTGREITRESVQMWRGRGVAHWARPIIAKLARDKRKASVLPKGFIVGVGA